LQTILDFLQWPESMSVCGLQLKEILFGVYHYQEQKSVHKLLAESFCGTAIGLFAVIVLAFSVVDVNGMVVNVNEGQSI
jgi:hypothetical protein